MARIAFGIGLAAAVGLAAAAFPALSESPLIAGHGTVVAVDHPGVTPVPSLDYKVVISVTVAGEAGQPPHGLDSAARLANLLEGSGVPANHRHIVVVIHGPATFSVLNEAGSKAHNKGPNPSAELIAALTKAGVRVDVCGQALAGAHIARGEVLPEVQVDLSALTTMTTLELQGYALVPA